MFCIYMTCNLVKIGKIFNRIIKITNGKKNIEYREEREPGERSGIVRANLKSKLYGILYG